jgi:hypothetical protein
MASRPKVTRSDAEIGRPAPRDAPPRRMSEAMIGPPPCDARIRGEIEGILADAVEDAPEDPEFAALNAYMREQRHQRMRNKARAESQNEALDIDACIAQAERAQALRAAEQEKKRKHGGGCLVKVSESGHFVTASDSVQPRMLGRG